jgi:thioesterase domain-containing protein/acyl carrier protein
VRGNHELRELAERTVLILPTSEIDSEAPGPSPRMTQDNASFALTAPQTALLLDQSLHPHKPIYNTGQTLTMRTVLDTESFVRALHQVVSESDALRTKLVWRAGHVHQQLVDHFRPDVEFKDVSEDARPAEAANAWIERRFWQPIEPWEFPLFRFALVKVAHDRYLWLQAYHHLIIDGTGRHLVCARVAQLYNALVNGEQPPAVAGGTCRAAREVEDGYLKSDQYNADEAYWRLRFADLPNPVIKAAPETSEKLRSGRQTRVDCHLSRAESDVLREFARSRGSTVFKVLIGLAWACFSRLYQTTDLVFGVPLANRSDPFKQLVALFASVMPFRVRLDPAVAFGQALEAIDKAFAADLEHRRFPTDHINRMLHLRRLNRAGLYDVVVNYVRNDYSFRIGDAPVTCNNISAGFAVPWNVIGLEYGAEEPIRILIEYDRGRIDATTADEFVECFRSLLRQASCIGDHEIGSLANALSAGQGPAEQGRAVDAETDAALHGVALQHAPRHLLLPRDDVERAIVAIWQRYLDGAAISIDDDYFALGGDSLNALLLIGECNDYFQIDLSLSTLFERRTVKEFARAVRECSAPSEQAGVVRLKEGGGGPPLFLIHPVGGALFCYQKLVLGLRGDGPVYGLQAAGLRAGERLPDSIEEMAIGYVRAASAIIDGANVHLAGWSFGGLVAFEMARVLALAGMPVLSLTLIDTPARLNGSHGRDDDDAVLRAVAGALGIEMSDLKTEPDAVGREALRSAVHRQSGSAGLSDEQLGRMIDLVRNSRRLRLGYHPTPLSGAVTFVRATQEAQRDDFEFDWTGLVDGPIDVIPICATHHSIILPPHVDRVAEILNTMTAAHSARP